MDQRRVTQGFFPVVFGQDVHVERGGGVAFLARRHLTVHRGGGQWLVAAGDMDVRQGGGAAMIARNARIEQGFVAMLFGWNVHLAPGARVLLRPTAALSVAVVAGFLTGWLVGRRE